MNETVHPGVSPASARWSDLLRGGLAGRTAVVSAGIAIHAFNEVAIAPIMPVALADLGAIPYLAWVYTLFFVGVVAGAMTAAALRARLGPRRAMMLALALYLVGIVAGGLAPDIRVLIGGRFVLGLADGWVVGLSYTFIPSLFPAALIAKVFAVEAVVWAAAAILGPVASGILVEIWGWRPALMVSLPLLLLLALIAPRVLPVAPGEKERGQAHARLELVALCVVAGLLISIPSIFPRQPWTAVVLPLSGLIFYIALRLDRGRAGRLFPSRLFDLHSTLGRGTWMLLMMTSALSISLVFLALTLREIFGLQPIWVGLISIVMSVTWSAVAVPVGNLRLRGRRLALRSGPAFQSVGLLILGCGLALVSLTVVVFGQMLIGFGFALTWAIGNQAIMEDAEPQDQTKASAILPALSTSGYVIGSGIGGWVAVLSGFFDALEQGSATMPILVMWGTAASISILALIAAQGVRPRGL